MVLLGGVQTLTGPVLGAGVFILLQDWITRATPYWQAVLGSAIILLTIVVSAGDRRLRSRAGCCGRAWAGHDRSPV